MTGRELIIYILQNGLEDENIFKDGLFAGFLTVEEAAVKLGTGIGTIKAWYDLGMIDGLTIGEEIYIFKNAERPTVEKQVSTYKKLLGLW